MKLYYKDEYCTLTQGDCLEVMEKMAEKGLKFDAIITDPPYGTTACKWDTVIPFDKMWECLKNLLIAKTPIVLFSSQPFTSALIMSNPKMFKYEWIWKKAVGSNFATLKYQPMKEHESILVFGCGSVKYYPIKEERKGSGKERQKAGYKDSKATAKVGSFIGGKMDAKGRTNEYDELRYPSSVQFFNNREKERGLHPTQKPVELMEYLIKTYTNEGDTILDFTCGSGTTLVAAKKLKRKCYGIELEEKYCEITKNRLLGVEL
jgi:site-specific DNA-methyltransferase (adenine-specific)